MKKSLKGWKEHDDFGTAIELAEIIIGGIIIIVLFIVFLKRVVWS